MEVFRGGTTDPLPARRVPVRVEGAPKDRSIMSARLLCNPDGILTHWVRGGSVGCVGDDCPPATHRVQWVFKAYCAAEWWIEDEHVWRPIALEITEALYPHLVGRSVRGEVWNVWRVQLANKHTKVLCALDSVLSPNVLPTAFDFRAVVSRVIRCPNVKWGVVPHLPAQVHLETSVGAPPLHRQPEAETAPTPEAPKTPAEARRSMKELWEEHKRKQA